MRISIALWKGFGAVGCAVDDPAPGLFAHVLEHATGGAVEVDRPYGRFVESRRSKHDG